MDNCEEMSQGYFKIYYKLHSPIESAKFCFATHLFNLSLLNMGQNHRFRYLCAGNVSINLLKQYGNELNKQETDIWETFAFLQKAFH